MKHSIVVFETRRRWVPELERQFPGGERRVRACSRLSDLTPLLANSPSVVVLDFDGDQAGCLRWLGQQIGRRPHAPVIVIGSAQAALLEFAMRELGAVAFVLDTTPGEHLARLIRRHMSTRPTAETAWIP